MADLDKLTENLRREGFLVSRFPTAQAAAEYLNRAIDGQSVGFGGSMTVEELGLFGSLSTHNRCFSHLKNSTREEAMAADIYISSLNGVSENGELINIDGMGNRVAASLYGRKKVYFIVGVNKVAPDYDAALWRARNVASPKNAQRLGKKTPCALRADRCYDCKSPDRICRALVVLWEKPSHSGEIEVVLVDEALGY